MEKFQGFCVTYENKSSSISVRISIFEIVINHSNSKLEKMKTDYDPLLFVTE